MRDKMQVTGILITVLIALAAGLAGGFISRAINTGTVRAKNFELVDANGKKRGGFDTIGGVPGLVLLDSTGKMRVALGAVEGGESKIVLFDSAGKMRCAFAVVEGGDTGLILLDSTGTKRGAFGTLNGEPALQLFDSSGRTRKSLSTANNDPAKQFTELMMGLPAGDGPGGEPGEDFDPSAPGN